jgi:UDP-N-acetylglucosamine/UDP-N-acetylgalactosamine diphosphorylase
LYIANLLALEQWYIHVRKMFFEDKEFGLLIHAGVLEKLQMAKDKRIKRLKEMAAKIEKTSEEKREGLIPAKKELCTKVHLLEGLLDVETPEKTGLKEREGFLQILIKNRERYGSDYIRVIQGLPADTKRDGTEWLNHIVRVFCKRIAQEFPALNMFKKMRF